MPHPVFHPGPDWFPDLAETALRSSNEKSASVLGEPKSKIKFIGVHITRSTYQDNHTVDLNGPEEARLLYHVVLSGLAGDWVPKPWEQPWSEAVEELAKNEFALGCAKWTAEQFGGKWYGTANSNVGEQRSLSASDRLMCAVTNRNPWWWSSGPLKTPTPELEPEAKVRLLKLATNTALGESQAIHTAPRSDSNDCSESRSGNQLLEAEGFYPLDLADFSRLEAALAEEGAILQTAGVRTWPGGFRADELKYGGGDVFKIAYTPTKTLADKINHDLGGLHGGVDIRSLHANGVRPSPEAILINHDLGGLHGGVDIRSLQKMFGITQLWLMPDKGIAGVLGPSANGLWTVAFRIIDMTGEWAKVVNKIVVKNSLGESDEDEIMDEESESEKSNLFHLDPRDFEHLKQALSERIILKKAYVLVSWLGRPLAAPELRLRYKPVVNGDWCDSWLDHKLCGDAQSHAELWTTATVVIDGRHQASRGFSAFAVDCLLPQWLKMAYKGVVKSRINFGRT